jgi:hypothetical protein
VAAWNRPVAWCADWADRGARTALPGAGLSSALHGAPLGPLVRRVWFPGHSVTFAIAGPCRAGRAGRNNAVRAGGNPVGAGVAEASETLTSEADKGNILGHSGLRPNGRPLVADYRSVRAFPTPVT